MKLLCLFLTLLLNLNIVAQDTSSLSNEFPITYALTIGSRIQF